MGLEEILGKIRSETDKALAEIDSEIVKKVASIHKEGEEKTGNLRKNLLEKARKALEENRKSELAKARLDFKKALLEEKHKLIDEAFQKSFDYVRDLDDGKYMEFMKRLVLEVAEPGEGEIVVSKKDTRKIDPSFAKDINRTLQKVGIPATYKVTSEDINIAGGFILRVGKVEINCSLDSFFKEKMEELEGEVQAILFGKAKK